MPTGLWLFLKPDKVTDICHLFIVGFNYPFIAIIIKQ